MQFFSPPKRLDIHIDPEPKLYEFPPGIVRWAGASSMHLRFDAHARSPRYSITVYYPRSPPADLATVVRQMAEEHNMDDWTFLGRRLDDEPDLISVTAGSLRKPYTYYRHEDIMSFDSVMRGDRAAIGVKMYRWETGGYRTEKRSGVSLSLQYVRIVASTD